MCSDADSITLTNCLCVYVYVSLDLSCRTYNLSERNITHGFVWYGRRVPVSYWSNPTDAIHMYEVEYL